MRAPAFLLILLLQAVPLPAQTEAPLLQQAIQAEREGRLDDARAILASLVASEPANAPARMHLQRLDARLNRAEALRLSLSRIILPGVRLEDVSAREAVDYLAQAVAKTRPGFRLNTVWMVPPDHPGRVSLQLENIPASEALRYAAEAAGLLLTFEEHAIKIRTPSPPSPNASATPNTPAPL